MMSPSRKFVRLEGNDTIPVDLCLQATTMGRHRHDIHPHSHQSGNPFGKGRIIPSEANIVTQTDS